MTESKLSHLDERGNARMVDVSKKSPTSRHAVAEATVRMAPATMLALRDGRTPKGDVIATARIAGIQASKRTSELVPLCHPISLDAVSVDVELDEREPIVRITARARTTARTGVEMEALVAASVAALTLYDMLKAIDRGMEIEKVRLLEKHGGQSGSFVR